jgi:hypothetical protein
VTIMGRGFGIHDYSARAWGQQFGTDVATASTSSIWHSTSYVTCRIGMKATGLAHKLILISSGRNIGSICNIFSYDQPTVITVGGGQSNFVHKCWHDYLDRTSRCRKH